MTLKAFISTNHLRPMRPPQAAIPPTVEKPVKNYRLTVTLAQLDHETGYTTIYQVPTFVYETQVLGIMSAQHAESIAVKFFSQLGFGVSATAVEIEQ